MFYDALSIAVAQRVAEQLKHTDALLDKYVNILSKTENVARLITDEQWLGAEAVCDMAPCEDCGSCLYRTRAD